MHLLGNHGQAVGQHGAGDAVVEALDLGPGGEFRFSICLCHAWGTTIPQSEMDLCHGLEKDGSSIRLIEMGLFNFFKKSAKQSSEAWKGGAVVSGFDIHLGFVSIKIEPGDDGKAVSSSTSTSTQIVSKPSNQSSLPRRQLSFTVEQNASDDLAKAQQLMIDYFFNTPDYFEGNKPHFPEEGWRRLSGNIQLTLNEPLWIVGQFANTSGKLLYKVPVSLKDIPVISNLAGYLRASAQPLQQLLNVTKGVLFETWNANAYVEMHCFCRVPPTFDSKGKFAFLPYEIDGQSIVRQQFNQKCVDKVLIREFEPAALELITKFYSLYNARDYQAIKEVMLSSKPFFQYDHVFESTSEKIIDNAREDFREFGRWIGFVPDDLPQSDDGYRELINGQWVMGFTVRTEVYYNRARDDDNKHIPITDEFKFLVTNKRDVFLCDVDRDYHEPHYWEEKRRAERQVEKLLRRRGLEE
jgi:hypothetical protein